MQLPDGDNAQPGLPEYRRLRGLTPHGAELLRYIDRLKRGDYNQLLYDHSLSHGNI